MNEKTLKLAIETRELYAGSSLLPVFAKLYSQHTRLLSDRPGLLSWGKDEARFRLDDAIRLIHVALIEREAGKARWVESMRRAGELLEWLSHNELKFDSLPTRLLSAATYQLAGYPARSMGLFKEESSNDLGTLMLTSMLSADFPCLCENTLDYWMAEFHLSNTTIEVTSDDKSEFFSSTSRWLVNETVRVMGILYAYLRWGDNDRLEIALGKLKAIGKAYVYGDDPYNWLLMKLCGEIAVDYHASSLRNHLAGLSDTVSTEGQRVIERYARLNYTTRRSIIWPSQIRGIKQLATNESFALCTPTGSGKTTVAELAIIQNLFLSEKNPGGHSPSKNDNIALYLVPSKALATEVESKLSYVFREVSRVTPVTVTGLYGGTDWGPTDAWLTASERTVLICTYEKAEALIRFLGPLFLHRVSLVVVDEAHTVQFDGRDWALQNSDSRPLRLETLCSRLFSHLPDEGAKIVALSAVAAGIEDSLASWVLSEPGKQAIKTNYKSTRQLVGRLECQPNRRFQIVYDILDGADLSFDEEGSTGSPFIPEPFPPFPAAPGWDDGGPEKHLRPYLLWAAMHLASPGENGVRHSVLISITQHIKHYASDFLRLLGLWEKMQKPSFFEEPRTGLSLEMWQKSLESCADYFGEESKEYRLLKKGIVLHHAKMPGIMSRLLVGLIQERVVNIVVATSTLSEGVNLPFETVLIPSLKRWDVETSRSVDLTSREFGNLIGRAGRPGSGTEGRSLVLLSHRREESVELARSRYESLINDIKSSQSTDAETAKSPLARLIQLIMIKWSRLSGSKSASDFLTWLETAAPTDPDQDRINNGALMQCLDSLDYHLLSAIEEVDNLIDNASTADELERNLLNIWRKSYACYVDQHEETFKKVYVTRGLALKHNVFPDDIERRRLYKSRLPPREGRLLLELYPRIKDHLVIGSEYAAWDVAKKIEWIAASIDLLATIPKFALSTPLGGRRAPSWQEILFWWLAPNHCPKTPDADKVEDWYSFVNLNFIYKFNWGLGNTVAIAHCDEGSVSSSLSIQEWPKLGLPWAVFWLKEMVIWGTLDPVATCILSHSFAVTRAQAERLALLYYEGKPHSLQVDEILNASSIKTWLETTFGGRRVRRRQQPLEYGVTLKRDFGTSPRRQWRVLPVEVEGIVHWLDPAGFLLASCQIPLRWDTSFMHKYDFVLDVDKATVRRTLYL